MSQVFVHNLVKVIVDKINLIKKKDDGETGSTSGIDPTGITGSTIGRQFIILFLLNEKNL